MATTALPAELVVDAKPGKEFAIVGLFIDGERFLEFAANQAQLEHLIESFGKARAVLAESNTVLNKQYKN